MKPLLAKAFIIFSATIAVAQGQTVAPVEINLIRSGIDLKGIFYISGDSGTFPTVILLHGFPGNEKDVLNLGMKLSEAGYNTMTFKISQITVHCISRLLAVLA